MALSTRLSALLADPALRQRMGTSSLEIVAEHAFGATLDRFEDVYDRVTARHSSQLGMAA